MTDKAKKILEKMKLRRLFVDSQVRGRILDEFNRENMDDVGPVGGAEQGMKVLSEINSMTDGPEQFLRSLEASVANLA